MTKRLTRIIIFKENKLFVLCYMYSYCLLIFHLKVTTILGVFSIDSTIIKLVI